MARCGGGHQRQRLELYHGAALRVRWRDTIATSTIAFFLLSAAEAAGETAGADAEADTATWMTGLDGGSGAGLLPPGSAFRMLAQASLCNL